VYFLIILYQVVAAIYYYYYVNLMHVKLAKYLAHKYSMHHHTQSEPETISTESCMYALHPELRHLSPCIALGPSAPRSSVTSSLCPSASHCLAYGPRFLY